MLKRLLSIVLTITLVLGMTVTSFAASQQITVFVNDVEIPLEKQAYINDDNGQVMVPIRRILEELGYTVDWNAKDSMITLSKGSDVIELKVGEPSFNVNDKKLNLTSKVTIKEDTTYVPIELFSRGLGLIVGWDNKHLNLNINEVTANIETFFGNSNDKEISNKLDEYMNALVKNENFHGSVLVADGENILLNKGYGFADFEQNTVNTSQTKFAIGSVTKQFTAMAIMQLSEKGLINVEDKLSKYLPDFPNGDLITIHDLLVHSSGLVGFTDVPTFSALDSDIIKPTDMLNLIKDMPLMFEPGETFSYSNTNYLLLGIIVEQLSNMSYEDYLEKNIFKPLNMNDTGVSYGKDSKIHDATAYTGYLEVAPIDDEILLSRAYGAGAMYSTVEDLYRWANALDTEKIVKKDTMDKILSEYISILGHDSYGYGWMLGDTPAGKFIYHGGNTLGFTANIGKYLDLDLSIIILSNNAYYDVGELNDVLTAIIRGEDYEMPEPVVETKIEDPEIYDKYVGKYDFIPGTTVDIFRDEDKLYAQLTGQGAFEIFPKTDVSFFAKVVDLEIEFIVEEDIATGLNLTQLGMEFYSPRSGTKEEREILDIDPSIYDDYVGEYELAPGAKITIIREEDSLYAQVTGQDKYEIFPASESEFFYKIVDAEIKFVKNDKDKVIHLIFQQIGQEITCKKIK